MGRLALGSVIHGALGPGAPFPVPGTARASPWLPGWQVHFPPWHLSSLVTTLRRNPAPPCTKLKRKAPTVRTCFLQDTKEDSLGFLCAQSKAGSLGLLGAQSMWEARAGGGLGGTPNNMGDRALLSTIPADGGKERGSGSTNPAVSSLARPPGDACLAGPPGQPTVRNPPFAPGGVCGGRGAATPAIGTPEPLSRGGVAGLGP